MCPYHPKTSFHAFPSLSKPPAGLPHQRPPCHSPGRVRSLGLPAASAGPGHDGSGPSSLPPLLGHPLLGHAVSTCARHRVSDPVNPPSPYRPLLFSPLSTSFAANLLKVDQVPTGHSLLGPQAHTPLRPPSQLALALIQLPVPTHGLPGLPVRWTHRPLQEAGPAWRPQRWPSPAGHRQPPLLSLPVPPAPPS